MRMTFGPLPDKEQELLRAAREATVIAYKGFDAQWRCSPDGGKPYQYEIGKTYEHSGAVKACSSGFHACEYPLDVWGYYGPVGYSGQMNRFAVVECSGELSRHEDDTKLAAARLTVKAEIKIPELVDHAVRWILARSDKAAAAGEDRSSVSETGDWSAATNTGNRSAATNTGNRSAATNTGDWSAATNTGNRSAATNTGDWSAATNTGNWSAATNTGNRSAATNTGDWSAATNTGNWSAATNTGDWSAATNTGDWSAATNTGDWSAATVEGKNSVAIATGHESRAKAAEGSAIVLVNRDPVSGAIRHIRAAVAGREVKPDVWYALDERGEFAEREADETQKRG